MTEDIGGFIGFIRAVEKRAGCTFAEAEAAIKVMTSEGQDKADIIRSIRGTEMEAGVHHALGVAWGMLDARKREMGENN